jgi:hypothetical protein
MRHHSPLGIDLARRADADGGGPIGRIRIVERV